MAAAARLLRLQSLNALIHGDLGGARSPPMCC